MSILVEYEPGSSTQELQPVGITDQPSLDLLDSGLLNLWWPGQKGMMRGVISPNEVPFGWTDVINTQSLTPFPGKKPPLVLRDETIGADFLRFGYGGDLERCTNRLRNISIGIPGSNYTTNEEVTFNNGVVLRYTGSTGVFSPTGFKILDYGNFTTRPTTPLVQVSSTGNGTGAVIIPEFEADNGSVSVAPPSLTVGTGEFFICVAYRCPKVEDQPNSGGTIIGSMANHSDVYFPAANSRWFGMRVGHQSTPGRLVACLVGDQQRIDGPLAADRRDNIWHIDMITGTPNGATIVPAISPARSLWMDSVNSGSIINNFTTLSSITGSQALRAGAAGLPESGPTCGFVGDIGAIMVGRINLGTAASSSKRRQIFNYMFSKFRPDLVAG